MTPSDPFGLVGQVLDGQFRVEKLVGEGGFSAVYRGHHLGLDEPVAIKCLKLPPALGAQLVDSFVQRFRDESRILYRLSQGNLHIVRSIGAGAAKATGATNQGMVVPYMVLEWLEGRSMANEFTVRKTLGKSGRTLDDAMSLFASAADALAYAHAQGVVHRDLNPGNLFLAKTPTGPHAEKMKVLDFGVAKILDDTTMNLGPRAQTMGQIRIFAPAYGSPEQFDDALGAVASPSDVYSFSLVLLESLRDKPVNDGSNLGEFATAAIDPVKRPTPRSLGLNLPDAVEQVFAKATKLRPADRYANVGEMWKALEAAAKSKPATSGRSTAVGLGGSPPLSKTMPLNSPNLTLPRPSPGLPSKASTPPGPGPVFSTSKVKPASAPGGAPGSGASPMSTSLPGVGNARAPAMNPALGATAPATQRFDGVQGGVGGLPPPPARPLIARIPPSGNTIAKPASSPTAASPGMVTKKRALSEPPLYENEELPTRVGQSISMDAMPSEPPKGIPKLHGEEQEEQEDVTRVRAPEEDLLAAAASAALAGNASAPPGGMPSGGMQSGGMQSGKPARPSPIPPAPDSGHTLMMPPGGGGIAMPSSDPSPMTPPPGQILGQGGLGSTVALAHGPGISDLHPSPYQPQQAPPYSPPMQPGYQGHQSAGQPMQSTPFPGGDWQQQGQHAQGQHSPSMQQGTPQMGVPAHFAQAQPPPQFQQSAFPTGAHAQPGAAQPQQGGKPPVGLIIAAVAFLVIGIGGLAVFFLMGRNPGPSPDNGTSSATAAPTPVPVPSPEPTPVVTAPPVVDPNGAGTAQPVADNSAGTAPTPTTTAAPTNTAPTPVNPVPGPPAVNPSPGPTAVNPGPTPVSPGPGPTPVPKPVPSAAPAVDPNAWNEGAARARLAQANGVLVFCKKPDNPTGPGSASVTFGTDGSVSSVTLDPPYAGTKAGECVAGQFKRAKVNAFQGSSQTIKHNFDVPK